MNGKQAKLLRKVVGFIPAAVRSYTEQPVKTVMVDTGRLDGEGKAIIIPQVRVIRFAQGARRDYRMIKRDLYAITHG